MAELTMATLGRLQSPPRGFEQVDQIPDLHLSHDNAVGNVTRNTDGPLTIRTACGATDLLQRG